MERPIETDTILEHLMCPAFLVRDGIIFHANRAALQLQITPGCPIEQLIEIGKKEYAEYTDGKLCLTLLIGGISYACCVTELDSDHLFCLETDYQSAELRAFALAAQYLRGPLSNAISGTEQLLNQESIQQSSAIDLTAQINRSLHQMLRAIGNMSDAAGKHANATTQNAVWIFEEILQKTKDLMSSQQKELIYKIPRLEVSCMLDREQLERAILNLISNAFKYATPGSAVSADLSYRSDCLYFTVENDISDMTADLQASIFSRYLREPGISDGNTGIGLGMSLVRNIAAKHGGTVLLEHSNNRMRITMTIHVATPAENIFRSPVRLPIDYSGGFDHSLIELSEILPASNYKGKF